MAVDYAEKEREFLENLEQDTGRDLAQWMSAIGNTGLHDRNAIIDWLRQQGFLFARASWMERIHHNGGRPIYLDPKSFAAGAPAADKPALPPVAPPHPSASPVAMSTVISAAAEPVPVLRAAQTPPPPVRLSKTTVADGLSLDAVLTEAKGYRPLAHLALKEIERVAPGVSFVPHAGYIAILAADGAQAGVLTVGAKELRLILALGTKAVLPPFSKPKLVKPHADIPGAFTHMVVLTDARQVTPDLLAAIAVAVFSG